MCLVQQLLLAHIWIFANLLAKHAMQAPFQLIKSTTSEYKIKKKNNKNQNQIRATAFSLSWTEYKVCQNVAKADNL